MRVRNFIIWICVIIAAALVAYAITCREVVISIAMLLILAMTLIALIIYTSDTHAISQVTKSEAELRKPVLLATNPITKMPDMPDRTMFSVKNPSTVLVRAKVRCRIAIYGELVPASRNFDGTKTWYIYPQQLSRGWFELSPILTKKGKTYDQMKSEQTEDNRQEQLTLDLEVSYRDELNNERTLPEIHSFFDFKEGAWIPHITRQDDW